MSTNRKSSTTRNRAQARLAEAEDILRENPEWAPAQERVKDAAHNLKVLPLRVERVDRTVIEGKLLASLEDKDVVAILFTKQDLEITIGALDSITGTPRHRSLADGMRQLLKEAFTP